MDGSLRLAPGVYPMGGNFDSGTPSQITNSTGLGLGDGFTHFVTAPMVQMYKMEHLFEKGSTGSMALELERFITLSMDLTIQENGTTTTHMYILKKFTVGTVY